MTILERANHFGIEFLTDVTEFGPKFVVKFRLSTEKFNSLAGARLNTQVFNSFEAANKFRQALAECKV